MVGELQPVEPDTAETLTFGTVPRSVWGCWQVMGCAASTAVQADGAREDSVQRVLVQPATAPTVNFQPDSEVKEVCLSQHGLDLTVAVLTGRCIDAGQKQDETCTEPGCQNRQV